VIAVLCVQARTLLSACLPLAPALPRRSITAKDSHLLKLGANPLAGIPADLSHYFCKAFL